MIFGRFLLVACTAGIAASFNMGWCYDGKAKEVKMPPISEVVLFALQPIKTLDPARYSGKTGLCMRKYLDAIPPGSYLWEFEPPSSPEDANLVRRRVLAQQMIAILGKEVRAEAEAFTHAIPLASEWEGMSEGPIQEADFIDQWLRQHPRTSIAPFLHLMKAHRLRAGYEAARARQEKETWPVLAKRYRQALIDAALHTNPLIACIAHDLEREPYVYLGGHGRP